LKKKKPSKRKPAKQPPKPAKANRRIHNPTLLRTIQRNIRVARWNADVSQRDLARTLGVSQQFIHRLESGVRFPALAALGAIIEALGVDWNGMVKLGGIAPDPRRGKPPQDMRGRRAS